MGRQNYAAPSSARHARRNTLKRIAISLVAWAFVITGSASAATLAAAEPTEGTNSEQLAGAAGLQVDGTEAGGKADDGSDSTSSDGDSDDAAGSGSADGSAGTEGDEDSADSGATDKDTGASDGTKDDSAKDVTGPAGATTLSLPGDGPALMSVPAGQPGANEAHLIVAAGGDRVGTSTTVTPVTGATFSFYRVDNGTALSGGTLVGSCTTDPGDNGTCGVTVPLNTGSNYFYVTQTSVPGPYSVAGTWGSSSQYVRYNTGAITRGGDVSTRIVTMPGTDRTYPSVLANTPLPAKCGLDLALVFDVSLSVSNNSTYFPQYKSAGKGFVDALVGTPSRIGLYTFATTGPAAGNANRTEPLTSVASGAGPQTLRNRIDGLAAPSPTAQGYTNWDMGLAQVDAAGVDAVIFLTDGDPTAYRNQPGSGTTATLRTVEEAIHSANKVKADSHLIVVGIGGSVGTNEGKKRLSLLSSDYHTASFEEVGELLREIALENCLGTLTVVKQERGYDGTLTPGKDWTFSSSSSDVTPASGQTGSDGALNFEIGGFNENTTTRDITVTETPQPGFTLEQQKGLNATCTNTVNGRPVTPTNSGATGFTVSVPYDAAISCQVINAAEPWDELTVSKTATTSYDREYTWEVDKSTSTPEINVPEGEQATADYGVEVTAVDQIDSNITVSGTISVGNTNPGTITVDLADTLAGATCTIDGGASDRAVPPGGVDFDYECTASSIASVGGTNTAKVTWDKADVPGTSGKASATAPVTFGGPATETNRYVTVEDVFDGGSAVELPLPGGADTLDWVQVKASGPVNLTYSTEIDGTPGECTTFENTASVVGDDEEALDEDTAEVEVCVGMDLVVTKNVALSLERTYAYDIEKSVDATKLDVDPETGEATFSYTVTVTDGAAADSNWLMTGVVTVTNPNDWAVTADVTDVASVGFDQVCEVSGPESVPAGGSAEFDYTCLFTGQPDYDGTNTATVTWDQDEYFTPNGSAEYVATFAESDWSLTKANETVTVVDDLTDPSAPVELGDVTWTAEGTETEFTYDLTLEGTPGECVSFTNHAWIEDLPYTGDDQDVTVCWPLDVSVEKTVDATFDREYFWLLDKEADRTEATISEGGTAEFTYVVSATPDGFQDSAWAMSGEITVSNPNATDVTVGVTDTPAVPGVSECTIASPTLLVPARGEASTTYVCGITGQPGYEGTNTATVAWTDVNGVLQSVTTDEVEVSFELAGETNKSVEVYDDLASGEVPGELLGTAEWNAEGEATEFEYSLELEGLPGQCVEYTNTAVIPDVTDPTDETVTVCVEVAPEVSKTAEASFDREYFWQLDKEVDATSVEVSGTDTTFGYTVTATPGGYEDSGWTISGQIEVTNPNTFADGALTVTVTDVPSVGGEDVGGECVVADGEDVVVGPGETVTLDYTCTFASKPAYEGTNVATVAWTAPDGTETSVEAKADVSFELDGETNKTVEVYDDLATGDAPGEKLGDAEWNAEGEPTVFEYELTLPGVPGECVSHTNTAVIPDTGDKDSATVEICAEGDLVVTKTAEATFDREYFWQLEKEAEETELVVEEGEAAELLYLVAAIPDGYEDSGWAMSGAITVTNPNQYAEGTVTVTVTDETNVGAVCAVADGVDVVLEPGQTRVFDYTCTFETKPEYEGVNTATVAWTGPDGAERTVTTDEVEVSFELAGETNREITVYDDLATGGVPSEELGTAEWNEEGEPTLFLYALELEGTPGECVEVTNTAVIPGVTDPTEETVTLCTKTSPEPGPDPKPEPKPDPKPKPKPIVPSGDPVAPVRVGLLVAGIGSMLLALLGFGRALRRQKRP